MKSNTVLRCALGMVLTAAALAAQEKPKAFVGAEIIPISGPVIKDGVLVVQGGKIVAIGPRASVRLPADAEQVNVAGRVIMPGLVDSHSHIGGGQGADGSAPIQPDVRILDSFNARDNSVHRARAGGITSVNVMPGSGHLLSGQTIYLKLRKGDTMEELAYTDAQGNILGGIKMANGTNSLRATSPGPFPGTRAKSAALVREQFVKAQEYRDKIKRAGDDKSKLPARDLAMESLLDAMEGRKTVHFHTHRHDDVLTAIRLIQEFKLRGVLHHVSEAWKVADQIAKVGLPASIIVIDSPGGKLETMDLSFRNGAALEKAGAKVAFHTDDYITDSRLFLRSAAFGVRAGMSRDAALRAITLTNAEILDLQKRVGSLQPGKDADFLVLSGDPLSVYTHVLETWVEGNKVFDRSNPEDHLYAVGGKGAGADRHAHIECFEGDTEVSR